MSLMNVTAKTLSQELEREVPEIYVIIAKHSVLGMDADSIREVLGCSIEDIQEVERDELYKEVRIHVGAAQAQSRVNQTLGWDAIEDIAMENLLQRLPYEKDSEFLLRVAAVANKAQRRQVNPQNVLDPSRQNGRTAITLTQRLVQRMTQVGKEVVEERTLSISDGSMGNPSFDEIDSLLSVSKGAGAKLAIQTHTADASFEELDAAMQEKGF